MHSVRKGAAFYMEVVLLVLFLLLALTVLVRMFGAARMAGRQAEELSTAVQLAENTAQTAAASQSRAELESLLHAAQAAKGGLVLYFDEGGAQTDAAVAAGYQVKLSIIDSSPAKLEITVEHEGQTVYNLHTEKYWIER